MGEFGGAVSIMTEFAPKTNRGLYGAWQSLTVALGLLVGAGLAAILATVLSKEALNDWGWRIPFLLALPLGLVALWLRLRLDETPNFERLQQEARTGATGDVTGRNVAQVRPADKAEVAKAIALGIGRLMGWSAAGYTFLVVMPTYLQATLNATFQQALVATVLANLGFAVSIIAGGLAERPDRPPPGDGHRRRAGGRARVPVDESPAGQGEFDRGQGDRRLRGRAGRRVDGRTGTRDAGGDVPDQSALHRPRPRVLAVERGLLRLQPA